MIPAYIRVLWKQTEHGEREYVSRFDDVTRAAAYVEAVRSLGFYVVGVVVVENG